MNLEKLSNLELKHATQRCAGEERKQTALLVAHLVEIGRRKLHLEWGYSTLFDYLVKELGYEKGSAGRRVAAVRAAEAVPDVASKIETGELTLKTIERVERYGYHESRVRDVPKRERRDLYMEVAGMKSGEVERRLVQKSTNPRFEGSTREWTRVTKRGRSVHFEISARHEELLSLAREVLSHRHPGASLEQVYFLALEEFVQRNHPKVKAERQAVKMERAGLKTGKKSIGSRGAKESDGQPSKEVGPPRTKRRVGMGRAIPAKVQREVWRAYDGGGCEWKQGERRCASKHQLQVDHKHPFAKGGRHEVGNLQILCAKHNRYKIQLDFGGLASAG